MSNTIVTIVSQVVTFLVGRTVEQNWMRFHRYNNSVQVTDLTNAGKRGKKCQKVTLSYDYMSPEWADAFAEKLARCTRMVDVEWLFSETAEEHRLQSVQFRSVMLRGVDVLAPTQVLEFETHTGLFVKVSLHEFRVTHKEVHEGKHGKFFQDNLYTNTRAEDAQLFYQYLQPRMEKGSFRVHSTTMEELKALWNSLHIHFDSQ